MSDLETWLRQRCDRFVFRPQGVYVADGEHEWPLVAGSPEDLTDQLDAGGHLVDSGQQIILVGGQESPA